MSQSRMVRGALAFGILGASLFAGGCATIVNGGNREITVATQPPGATASVRRSGGDIMDVVEVKKTPCTISLDPKKSYFSGQSYTLRLEMPGYKVNEVELTPKMSGWYWGNWLLHVKITLFVIAALISIRPTLQFARWRRELRASGALPAPEEVRKARKLVMLQAHIIPIIPLAAVFLARGFGGK